MFYLLMIPIIFIGLLYCRMILIWRDVMITQNNRILEHIKRKEQQNYLNDILKLERCPNHDNEQETNDNSTTDTQA